MPSSQQPLPGIIVDRRIYLDIHPPRRDLQTDEQDGQETGWELVLVHVVLDIGPLDLYRGLVQAENGWVTGPGRRS